MPNPVVHFEILGKDGKRSQELYAGLFGWAVNADNPMAYGMVDTQAGGINGGIGGADGGDAGALFYVEVDDPQTYLDKAVSLGCTVTMPVTEVPGFVTIARFADPDGNVIGLVKAGSMA